ncbi:isocitrate dehydrogenase (NADP(+)) [Candidatus Sumerlaeota bacterium]|nr:isocitrate dehydrogenase (NADP(+)) [Candidatus Sumerlaeota bacterium]
MSEFEKLSPPSGGELIQIKRKRISVPDKPIIPVIPGDGIGPEITAVMRAVVDAAVAKAFDGRRQIQWMECLAGEAAMASYGTPMPDDTVKAIQKYVVAIKGPLTTPVGGGIRSLNVAFRQILDLYACVRPVRYYRGVPSPHRRPQKVNVVIFRENTEDVYAGIEYKAGTDEANRVRDFLVNELGANIREFSGIGIKPISEFGSKRIVRKAIQYAIDNKRSSVTMMHKGNIMKFTEGAFRDWGYELAKEEFAKDVISEDELWEKYNGQAPRGMIVLKDRIADSMFQQIQTRPDEYDVIATPNLNGDFLSDAAAALVGGLGLAPGANIGDFVGLFEATHGTAPKYAGKNMVNPGSLILSSVMMLEYMRWNRAARLITKALQATIRQKKVTYDLERQMKGATKLGSKEFGEAIISNM